MLLLETANNLKNEKIVFFNLHIDFINKYMSDKIKDYVASFLASGLEECPPLDEQDMNFFANLECDKKLVYAILYVCYRQLNYRWHAFFDFIKNDSIHNLSHVTFPFSFFEKEMPNHYRIRQCRPDKKKIAYNKIINIALYNKNQNFSYNCYDYQDAYLYISQELGGAARRAYENLVLPQSQSDFFGIASLYIEGGISSDVCSIAQANIDILISDCDLFLVYDRIIDKKFIFAKKGNKFIKSYLEFLIEKADRHGVDYDYFNFSSKEVFHNYFLDFFAFRYHDIKDLKLNFLHNNIFSAFVRAEEQEETFFQDNPEKDALKDKQRFFPKVNVRGLVRKSSLSHCSDQKTDFMIENVNSYYMPASNSLITVGCDKQAVFSFKNRTPYSIASLGVWNIKNVSLSGHGCLWKEGQYLDFESYLCSVAENEARGGFWKFPTLENLTNVIEDPCIIAFGPGYGCYGHYLVDDLPRLALIKDALGDDFYTKKLIISHLTPEWAKNLLRFFLNAKEEQFLVFNHEKEIWKLKEVYVSSYPNKDYNFHGYIKDFYTRFSKKDIQPFRKVCLSRGVWTKGGSHERIFETQELFEQLALERGFEIVHPETMSLADQIELMSETACQIGEHGSAQHASVYNYYGNMIVGTINPLTEVQSALGRVYNDKNIVCYADHSYTDDRHNIHFEVNQDLLLDFFARIEDEYQKRNN